MEVLCRAPDGIGIGTPSSVSVAVSTTSTSSSQTRTLMRRVSSRGPKTRKISIKLDGFTSNHLFTFFLRTEISTVSFWSSATVDYLPRALRIERYSNPAPSIPPFVAEIHFNSCPGY